MKDGQPKAGWYKFTRRSDVLVLVEDPMSAIRLAPHFHTVCLFGTTVSEQLVEEFRGKYKRVWLALDADATKQSIQQVLQLRRRLNELHVFPLDRDIKDMSEEELEQCLQEMRS